MNAENFEKKMNKWVDEELNINNKADNKTDYNIFLALHKASREVNLHSRFLYSLLDVNGHHFKQSLFLKEFLSICIPDFFKDISKVYVKREENNIDILIKDNKKCIIVENKIKAKDGDRQIQKYIRQARKEYEKDENIAVIYLSLDRKEPHKKSLGNYNIKGNAIVYGSKQIKFVSINYNNQIIEWLKRCKKLDINRRLKDVIDQYLDVINILYGDFETKKHRRQLDFIKDHFTNALEIKFDNYLVKEVAYEIINNFIDDLAKGFNKNKKNNSIRAINIWNNHNTLLEFYSKDWENEKNTNDEKFILFSLLYRDNGFYMEILPHINMGEQNWRGIGVKFFGRCRHRDNALFVERIYESGYSNSLELARAINDNKIKIKTILEKIQEFIKSHEKKVKLINAAIMNKKEIEDIEI